MNGSQAVIDNVTIHLFGNRRVRKMIPRYPVEGHDDGALHPLP